MEQSHEYKSSKLKKELENKGYCMILKAVEIGIRGFVAATLHQFIGEIESKGVIESKVKDAS